MNIILNGQCPVKIFFFVLKTKTKIMKLMTFSDNIELVINLVCIRKQQLKISKIEEDEKKNKFVVLKQKKKTVKDLIKKVDMISKDLKVNLQTVIVSPHKQKTFDNYSN